MNKYRIGTDVPFQLSVDDGVEYLDLSNCTILNVAMYCDAQEAFAGSCTWQLNADDHTRLDCVYPGDKQVYTGIMRAVVVMEGADGGKKAYDLADIFEIVATTEEANATEDTVTSAVLSAWQLPMSTLSTIVEAAINATEAATETAIAEISYTASTEDDGINVLHLEQTDGTEHDFNIKNGSRGSQGPVGPQGEQGPQGLQGNPGSSQDYPFELVNNETTDDPTKAHTAAGGKRLKDEITELGQEVTDIEEEIDGIPAVNKSGVIPVVAGQVNQRSSGAKCVIDIPAGTYFFQMDSSFFNGLCRVYARINGSETHIGDLANINETSVTLPNDATEIYIYCTATVAIKTGNCSFSFSQDGVRGIRDDIADLEDKTEKIDGVSKDTSVSFTLTTTSQSAAGTKKDANIKKGKYWVDVSPMSLLTASNVYVYAYYASAPATSVLIGYIGTNMLNYWVLNGNTYLHEIQFNEDVVALSIYHANNATGAGNITLSFVDQEAVPSFDATIAQLTKKTSPAYSAFSDSGEIEVSGGVLALPKVHITKNSALSLEIDGTIEDVAFGIGYSATAGNKRGYTGYWCVLKPTTLELYYSDNNTVLIDTITHGLTLDDKTKVSIRVMDNVGTRKIRITTKAGAVYENTANINFFGVGSPFVENNNTSAQISAKISFLPCDISKRIWVFGDSYCGVNNPARWMTQILNMGIGGFLLNAKGGEAAAEAVSDLDNLLSLGYLPTYILWCLGMNGTADGNATTVSDYQKLWLMRFLRRCTQNGITPILCTIPTVPSLQHNAYDAYIKTLGYRIVDLADAVGAQEDGTWYPGLISSDNVHPSEEGARVLAMRVLRDFPEIQLLES